MEKLISPVENLDMEKGENPTIYQGPVRPTDDEAYFRNTGITRPLEDNIEWAS